MRLNKSVYQYNKRINQSMNQWINQSNTNTVPYAVSEPETADQIW